jgi:uncharacterized membrane protein YhaH (DUF805 family)
MKTILRLFTFTGRISRSGYWLYSFVPLLGIFLTVFIVSKLFSSQVGVDGLARFEDVNLVGRIVTGGAVLALAWFSICMEVKRWHDRNKSAWWLFVGLIPVIGGIWTLIECGFRRGTVGPNKYGDDPWSSRQGIIE